MNTEAYLNHINYTGYLTPDLEVLKNLQKNHLLNVPFENLDVHYGKTIYLDAGKIYRKIVVKKRGGFCYELNGLFSTLLNALSFNSRIFMVSKTDGETKTPEYIFTRKKRELYEFREMCHYHQTSPDSHFTQKRLISKPTETGRITISGNTLKITEGGKVIMECDFRDDEFEQYVKEWFAIDGL